MTTETDAPTINEPLLQRVLDYITLHPEEHDQATWIEQTGCGTIACLAGHTVRILGYDLVWTGSMAVLVAGCEPVGDVAMRELGLTDAQAAEMFYGAGGIDELWGIAERITDGRVRPRASADAVAPEC